jgi:hypothetical protein
MLLWLKPSHACDRKHATQSPLLLTFTTINHASPLKAADERGGTLLKKIFKDKLAARISPGIRSVARCVKRRMPLLTMNSAMLRSVARCVEPPMPLLTMNSAMLRSVARCVERPMPLLTMSSAMLQSVARFVERPLFDHTIVVLIVGNIVVMACWYGALPSLSANSPFLHRCNGLLVRCPVSERSLHSWMPLDHITTGLK